MSESLFGQEVFIGDEVCKCAGVLGAVNSTY